MHHQPPFSPGGRDRGLQRLRRLTVGAAVGSTAAMFGFGALAAVSYAGKTTATAGASAPSTSTSSPSQSTTTTTPTPTPVAVQPAATPPTSGSGRTPVTTGGS